MKDEDSESKLLQSPYLYRVETEPADPFSHHHHQHRDLIQDSEFQQSEEAKTLSADSTPLLNSARQYRKAPSSASASTKVWAAICSSLPFIIAISVVLADSDQDCDNPIRLWLFVTLAATCFSLGFYLLFNVVVLHCLKTESIKLKVAILCFNGLIGLFFTAWIIVGSVWLFEDSSCKDDFEHGYNMTLAILIICYISYGILGLAIFCICCCGAAGLGLISLAKQSETV
jgi:hypothetical protein